MSTKQYKQSVIEYFKNKASKYDLVDNQAYWKLSETILWEILVNEVFSQSLPHNFSFVDVGGGTGRWAIKIAKNYLNSAGTIIDISSDMLNEAIKKIDNLGLKNRLSILCLDLDKDIDKSLSGYDLAFCFHNVLGFVQDPRGTIKKMTKMVKPGGHIVCSLPNLYHNIFFNIAANNFELSTEPLRTGFGRFTIDMPAMHMFTPDSIREIYEALSIDTILISGFPSVIYPGINETKIEGSTASIDDLLNQEDGFNKIKNIELQLYKRTDISARGNQIIAIGKTR